MSDVAAFEDLLLLIVAALLPALVYLAWIRKTERFQTEPWSPLLGRFLFGALVATFVAAILEAILVAVGNDVSRAYPAPEFTFLNGNSTLGAFFLVLVIAPFVEEGLKASGVTGIRNRLRLVADGPVYGASVGLGFGFFETFLYGLGAFLVGGLVAGLVLIVVRSLSSVLLHGSTTAMFGYGYASSVLEGRRGRAGAYYLLAVAMHGSFNFLASLGAVAVALGYPGAISDDVALFGLLLAIVYAFAAIEHARSVIQRTDFPSTAGYHPRFRPPPVKRRDPPAR